MVIVTLHPSTLAPHSQEHEVDTVVQAMEQVDATWVVTLPNSDPGNSVVRDRLQAFVARQERAVAVEALGERRYFGLMRVAEAMAGNSSSALVEAPAVGLPALDIGDRQAGRERPAGVEHAPVDEEAITAALMRILEPGYREETRRSGGPAHDGKAGERVARLLRDWVIPSQPTKIFRFLPGE